MLVLCENPEPPPRNTQRTRDPGWRGLCDQDCILQCLVGGQQHVLTESGDLPASI